MAKKDKKQTIVTLDPISQKLYRLSDSVLDEILLNEVKTKFYNTGYLSADSIMYASIEVPTDTDEDEVSIITNKAYEMLELDLEGDYKISYQLSNASIGINSIYNVFVVENSKITESFGDIAKKMQYIDYIDMEPLVYQNLYSSKMYESEGIHVYFYIHKTYATLTVYKDGELINFRIISKMSIDMLHSAHCHDLAERVPEHLFIDDLNKYGLDHIDDSKRISLNKVFVENFAFVRNNLNIIFRTANLEKTPISRFFFGCDIGLSENILRKIKILFANYHNPNPDELQDKICDDDAEPTSDALAVYEFENLHKLKFDIFKNINNFTKVINSESSHAKEYERNSTEVQINPLLLLLFLRANEQIKNPDDNFNISPYTRPPAFFKRYSGKLILSAVAIALLASAYPGYNYTTGYLLEQENEALKEEIATSQKEYTRIKTAIEQEDRKIAAINNQINAAQSKLNYRQSILNSLYDKKVNYFSKVQATSDFVKLVNQGHVKIARMDLDENIFKIQIKGKAENITKFLKILGADERYVIETNQIVLRDIKDAAGRSEHETQLVVRVENE